MSHFDVVPASGPNMKTRESSYRTLRIVHHGRANQADHTTVNIQGAVNSSFGEWDVSVEYISQHAAHG
jgi:hypothetical protein